MEQDIKNLYNHLEIQDVIGKSGKAVAGENSNSQIVQYTNSIMNRYNAFSNMDMEAFSPEIIDAMATVVTTTIEKGLNSKFHNGLTLLEKNGIISQEKIIQHQMYVTRAKTVGAFGVYATFTILPYVCDCVKTFLEKQDYIDFIVGVYSYINQDMTPLINQNIRDMLGEMGILASTNRVNLVFDKYCNNNGISSLPLMTRKGKLLDLDKRELLAKEIVSRCDLHSVDILDRAEDFLQSYLKINETKAKSIISDAKESQNAVSDMIWFSAISYRYLFADFIRDISNAQRFAYIDINNDPYSALREKRRVSLEKTITTVSSDESLFLTNKRRKDTIEASAKLMQFSLNPSYDISTDIKMIKRERKILDYYGL